MTDATPDTMPGRFISFEGGEGTGKSTQAARLAARLRASGVDVLETREPGGTPGAEIIRRTVLSGRVADFGPFAEALLMNAARDDHLSQVIRPALAAGRWVVCDRFSDSTRAYQGAVGGLDAGVLSALEDAVVGDTRPHLTIVLDIDPRIGLERARAASREAGAGDDRFEDIDISQHERLREAFLEIARSEPDRCVLIPADGSPDGIGALVWNAVETWLLTGRAKSRQTAQS